MSEQQPQDQQDPQGHQYQLTGHNYDGIQEYDNPTPAWWTWVFLVSVIFTPIYLIFTLMSGGSLTPEGQYERAYVANLEKQFGELGVLEPDAATILKYSEDAKWVAFGENVFKTHCATCHGPDGEGKGNAPNLTDDAYIHVRSIEDIGKVVIEGAANQAMPAWGNRLHPNEAVLVSAYVASIRDTNAPGGLAAKGEVPPPWAAGETPQAAPEANGEVQ